MQAMTCRGWATRVGVVVLLMLSAIYVWAPGASETPIITNGLPTLNGASLLPTSPVTLAAVPISTEPSAALPVAAPVDLSLNAASAVQPATAAQIHVVQRGDSLFRIGQQYGVSMEALIAANGLFDPSRLYIGQELIVPPAGITLTPVDTMTPTPTRPPPTATSLYSPTPAATGVLVAAPTGEKFIPNRVDLGVLTPLPTPTVMLPGTINGIPIEQLVVIPPDVAANVQAIYAEGQVLGRNPQAFSKIGDSIIENPHFLTRFDSSPYNLGDYAYLQPMIDYFHGSFGRQGEAVRRGLHAWSLFDPMWADGSCLPGEGVVECEFRVQNPSIVFIRLGSNDFGVPDSFDRNMRLAVEFAISNGIIPIIGTKADRRDGPDNINNTILRQIAADYQIVLWDFDLVAATLPGRGLEVDGVHLNAFFAHDYTQPLAFQRGHGVHNLTALLSLYAVWQIVNS